MVEVTGRPAPAARPARPVGARAARRRRRRRRGRVRRAGSPGSSPRTPCARPPTTSPASCRRSRPVGWPGSAKPVPDPRSVEPAWGTGTGSVTPAGVRRVGVHHDRARRPRDARPAADGARPVERRAGRWRSTSARSPATSTAGWRRCSVPFTRSVRTRRGVATAAVTGEQRPHAASWSAGGQAVRRWSACRSTAARRRASADVSGGWSSELNLDPRRRVAAGLGAAMVRDHQDALVDEAWRQAGDIDRARRERQGAMLADLAASRLRAPDGRAAHRRVGAGDDGPGAGPHRRTRRARPPGRVVAASAVPPAMLDSSMRRIAATKLPRAARIAGQGIRRAIAVQNTQVLFPGGTTAAADRHRHVVRGTRRAGSADRRPARRSPTEAPARSASRRARTAIARRRPAARFVRRIGRHDRRSAPHVDLTVTSSQATMVSQLLPSIEAIDARVVTVAPPPAFAWTPPPPPPPAATAATPRPGAAGRRRRDPLRPADRRCARRRASPSRSAPGSTRRCCSPASTCRPTRPVCWRSTDRSSRRCWSGPTTSWPASCCGAASRSTVRRRSSPSSSRRRARTPPAGCGPCREWAATDELGSHVAFGEQVVLILRSHLVAHLDQTTIFLAPAVADGPFRKPGTDQLMPSFRGFAGLGHGVLRVRHRRGDARCRARLVPRDPGTGRCGALRPRRGIGHAAADVERPRLAIGRRRRTDTSTPPRRRRRRPYPAG